jgi:ATP-dependent helicase/nuclease subunit A
MANEFTKEQKQAIETLDKSVLVSAAAGSGKTSVLIERIIRIILEGKANVDEMLVVTFTNAAASEMKLRLAGAIRKRMADHTEDIPRMKDQLARLYKAYISTIDSFALRVIKEFFHMTDMEPSFGVADDVQCELLRREALSELFEEGFENDDLIEG